MSESLFNKVVNLQSKTLSEKRLRLYFIVNFDEFLGTPILNKNYKQPFLFYRTFISSNVVSTLGFLSPFLKIYFGGIKVQHSLVNVTIQRSLPSLYWKIQTITCFTLKFSKPTPQFINGVNVFGLCIYSNIT